MSTSTAALSFVTMAAALSAQVTITPPTTYPDLGATVINQDANGRTIASIQQIEMRPLAAGTYRTVVTANLTGHADTSLVSGTIDLTTSPPTWTPNTDVDALNVTNAGTDEFQGSMSLDGLVIVWDNYIGATYPNASGRAFVCRRTSTSVPFQAVDVRPITGISLGIANYFDPHIGAELANGNVLMFFDDSSANISKGEVNPGTGAVTNVSLAVQRSSRPNVQWAHSPSVQRDSAGNPRALSFCEYTNTTGGPSDAWWTEGISNDGTPQMILPAIGLPNVPWYNNGAVVGGTWVWATFLGGVYGDPTLFEGAAVANADLSSGSGSIVAYTPIRPRGNGVFLSVVAIGSLTTPYPVPPVVGDILLLPTVGVTDVRTHDPFTGLAEWSFTNLPAGLGGPYDMQLITLDTAGNQILAANSATLIVP